MEWLVCNSLLEETAAMLALHSKDSELVCLLCLKSVIRPFRWFLKNLGVSTTDEWLTEVLTICVLLGLYETGESPGVHNRLRAALRYVGFSFIDRDSHVPVFVLSADLLETWAGRHDVIVCISSLLIAWEWKLLSLLRVDPASNSQLIYCMLIVCFEEFGRWFS